MARRFVLTTLVFMAATIGSVLSGGSSAHAAGTGQPYDWGRFYYYPYVYYPQNFQAPRQFDHLYYRYPAERRIPVYNTNWHNFYPGLYNDEHCPRPYHWGNHFNLDVF